MDINELESFLKSNNKEHEEIWDRVLNDLKEIRETRNKNMKTLEDINTELDKMLEEP